MLITVMTVFHVIFSIGLILSVLLQSGRSAGLSGAVAGGAQQLFGKKKGMDELLGRISTITAVLFMVTSLVITFLYRR